MEFPPGLRGDGRMKVSYMMIGAPLMHGTRPISMSVANARRHIEHLLANGSAQHSASGSTLWLSLYYLQWARKEYVMKAVPGLGYSVEITL